MLGLHIDLSVKNVMEICATSLLTILNGTLISFDTKICQKIGLSREIENFGNYDRKSVPARVRRRETPKEPGLYDNYPVL